MAKKNNTNLIVIVALSVLVVLLGILSLFLNILTKQQDTETDFAFPTVETGKTNDKQPKTIKEIIEDSGSAYISRSGTVEDIVIVNFKYNLFDENGKSKKSYFYNIIEQIEEIEDRSFWLKDLDKRIDIYDVYDPTTQEFKLTINKLENYYDVVDGDTYIALDKAESRKLDELIVTNSLILKVGQNSSIYARTVLGDIEKRVDLGNGYYSCEDGTILARLQGQSALNILFKPGYEAEEIAYGVKVGTPLETILEKYPKPSFGSLREGYLGYITKYAYVFFYDDEVSVYPYMYKENTYFDKYISDYCNSNNFEKLVSDFTTEWTSYFEKDFDLETKDFVISFPVRGIKLDIKNGDSRGITIYKNYYLTDTIKDLIKAKKITLNADKDLVDIVERSRRESM